jgi:hypothetical protein
MPPIGRNPNRLLYECMLQTSTSGSPSSIKKTFTNLVIGASYRLSFYHTRRLDEGGFPLAPPMSYSVILGGIAVHSTVPETDNSWEEVTLSDFIADSDSISLKFEIFSDDTLDRNIGIIAVNLLLVAGTFIIKDVCFDA